jgi:hypothetical protein
MACFRWEPMGVSPLSDIFLCGTNNVTSFNVKRRWCSGKSDDALLQWFPSDSSNTGMWAYIDGKVIRSNDGGSATIIDVHIICWHIFLESAFLDNLGKAFLLTDNVFNYEEATLDLIALSRPGSTFSDVKTRGGST